MYNELSDLSLPDGVSLDNENDSFSVVLESDIDKDEVKKWLKDITISSETIKKNKRGIKGF